MAIQGGTVRWIVEADTSSFEASMKKVDALVSALSTQLGKDAFKGLSDSAKKSAEEVDSAFSKAMSNISKSMASLSNGLAPFDSALTGLTTKLTAFAGIQAGLGARAGFGLVEQLESSQTGLSFLLKDEKKAADLMTKIRKEAQRTPFDVGNLSQYTQQLTAVTKDGNKALDTVLAFGQGIIASGQDLSALGLVAMNLQQIGATGRITQMDLMQFKRAVPIFEDVMNASGITSEQLKDMKDPLSAITKAFQKFGAENDVYGASANNIQQLKASFEEAFAGTFADAMKTSGAIDLIKKGIQQTTKALEDNKPLIEDVFRTAAGLLADFDVGAFISGTATMLKTVLEIGKGVGGVLKNVVTLIGLGDFNAGIQRITTMLISLTAIVKIVRVGSGVFSTFTGVLSKFGRASNTASKAAETVGKTTGTLVTSTLKPLASALPMLLKASLAIAAVGASIGVAIGAVGGGIFVFGKGLSALGQSFKDLGAGAQALGKADLSKFGTKLAQLAQGLSGVAPKFLDFTVAAATFPLIGIGIQELAKGMKALGFIKVKDFEKLPELAKALKEFQIDFGSSLFNGNILTKFKDLGDSVKNIADLINIVANIKIPTDKLKSTMSALSEGLKSFLITELQPSFLAKIFVADLKTSSVTDYLASLKNIIDPIQKFSDMQGKGLDSKKLKTNLQNIAEALKSFLITEVQPSYIEQIFGRVKSIKVSSVTNYLQDLGGIVGPISSFSEMTQKDKFDGTKLTNFLGGLGRALKSFVTTNIQEDVENFFNITTSKRTFKTSSVLDYVKNLESLVDVIANIQMLLQDKQKNVDAGEGQRITEFLSGLAKSLKAFTIVDINTSSSEFFEMTKRSKTINRTSVLQYAQNLGTVIDAIANIQMLLQDKEGNIDADEGQRITNFLANLGNALKAFVVKDISYEADEFLKGSVKIKTSSKSILDGANNFKSLADGVAILAGLFKGDHKIDTVKITLLIENIGNVLRTFNVVDTDKEWKDLLDRSGKVKTTHKNILGQIGNFNDFAKGVKTLTEITLNEKFDTQKIKNVMSSMKTFLSEFNMMNTESSWTKPFGESGSTKIVYSNILGQIGDFNNFANGVKTLVEATTIQNFNPAVLDTVTGSIGAMISSLNIFTVEHTEKYIGGERTWKPKYDNALAHIGDFKTFAEGVKILVEATTTKDFNPATFDSVLRSVGTLIRQTVFRETESSQDYNLLGKTLTKEKITSSLAHLGDFKNFAEGVKVIADLTSAQNFNPDTFNKVITNVFEAVKTLALKETESVQNGGWFGGGGSEKVNYSSALTKLGDFKSFVQSLSSLMSLNVGDGAIIKTLLTNVSEGVKKLLTISEIDTSPIDTEKLKALFSAIGTLKTNTTDWDTSGLAQKGLDIANFVKNIVTTLNTEFDANVQKLGELGTTMVTNIKNGITSALPQIQQAGRDIQGNFWNALESKMMDEFWQGSTMASKFNEGLRTQLNAVSQSGRDMQGSFWNAIEPKMMDEYHQGRALAGKLIEGINSQRGGLENSGRHAVNGFLTGAGSNWNSVFNIGQRIAGEFLRGVIVRGDQHSPWKTTYQSGIFAGQGLVNGILSMEDSLYGTAWSVTDTVVGIFENMNDTFQPRIAPEISGAKAGEHFISGGGNNGPRVIIEQTNNNYTQYSIDQMNRDLEWQLRKV